MRARRWHTVWRRGDAKLGASEEGIGMGARRAAEGLGASPARNVLATTERAQ
ncbi:MAG: hypothetical protein AAFU80_20590 [Pseudomonadota bacterium]